MQLWKRSMTWSRLRRSCCCCAAALGARDAARERRRTEAARAAARARARSSWSSLEPSGKAGGGDCSSSSRGPAAVPRAGGGVGAGASAVAGSAAGIFAADRSAERNVDLGDFFFLSRFRFWGGFRRRFQIFGESRRNGKGFEGVGTMGGICLTGGKKCISLSLSLSMPRGPTGQIRTCGRDKIQYMYAHHFMIFFF